MHAAIIGNGLVRMRISPSFGVDSIVGNAVVQLFQQSGPGCDAVVAVVAVKSVPKRWDRVPAVLQSVLEDTAHDKYGRTREFLDRPRSRNTCRTVLGKHVLSDAVESAEANSVQIDPLELGTQLGLGLAPKPLAQSLPVVDDLRAECGSCLAREGRREYLIRLYAVDEDKLQDPDCR